MKTACGRCAAIQRSTASWRRRSASCRVAVNSSQSSDSSRRTIADPAIPRWPATHTRLPFRLYLVVGLIMTAKVSPDRDEIGFHHFLHETLEGCFMLPPELLARLGRVTD